MLEKHNLILE